MAKPVGPDQSAEGSAYDKYLRDQEAAKLAKALQAQSGNAVEQGFQLAQPSIGASSAFGGDALSQTTTNAVSPGTLSIDPQFDPNVPQWDAAGSAAVPAFNLEAPAMIQGGVDAGMSASAGTMAGAGIAAAGQAVSIIAQLAGQKAAKDAMLAMNEANRGSSEKMARAALSQNQKQFDSSSRMTAYQQMLAALNQAGSQTMQQRALNRANSTNRADGLTTAFLGA